MSLIDLARQHIRPLLQLNDQLRHLCALEADINVTSIVAIGDQSHGKTSVIEALSGVDLPRGEGIQTRVPLVLMLRSLGERAAGHPSGGKGGEGPYAEISVAGSGGSGGSGGSSSGGEPAAGGGSQSERIELHEIADKVREYTARLAGDTKDVVDTPLELRVFQRDQDDLTLIDLPGMTRVPLKGQHRDIEATITGMYRKYMAPPESVLLNVVNAAVDISTSKSLQMSREMDPDGTRTLVCVTKVDQFTDDRFAEKMRAISSQMDVPLHSVFCVRNRSQAENEQGVPLEEVRVRERELFAQARYAGLAAENKGVPALSTKLVQQQCERIAASLPRAAQQVAARKDELESRLRSLPSVPESSSECREAVQRILSEGSDRLARQLIGVPVEARGRGKAAAPSVEELVGRAFVTHISVTPNVVKKAEGEGKDVSMAELVQGCEPLQLKLRLNVARRGHTYKRSVSAYATITAHDLKDIDVESVCVEVDCARSGESVGTALDPHGQGLAAIDLSELRADMQLRTVELEFTVVITDVTMRETGNAAEEGSLCSLAHREMAKMAEEVSGLYSGRYFFSDSFRSRVANQCELYAGSAGMPNTIGPQAPLSLLRDLTRKLPRVLRAFAGRVLAIATAAFKRELLAGTEDIPILYRLLRTLLEEVEAAADAKVHRGMDELLRLHTTGYPITYNREYDVVVNELRELIAQPTADSDEDSPLRAKYADVLSSGRLKAMRGATQVNSRRISDIQVEIYAFWRVLTTRVVDVAALIAHRYLLQDPIERMFTCLAQGVDRACAEDGRGDMAYIRLLSPKESQRNEVERCRARLAALTEAWELIRANMGRFPI